MVDVCEKGVPPSGRDPPQHFRWTPLVAVSCLSPDQTGPAPQGCQFLKLSTLLTLYLSLPCAPPTLLSPTPAHKEGTSAHKNVEQEINNSTSRQPFPRASDAVALLGRPTPRPRFTATGFLAYVTFLWSAPTLHTQRSAVRGW